MARKGNENGGFEPDPEAGSRHPHNRDRRQVNVNGGFQPDLEAGSRHPHNRDRRQAAASGGSHSSKCSLRIETGRDGFPVALYLSESVTSELPDGSKEVATQTESSPATVTSWRILRTQTEDRDATSVSASDYLVVETHALGHHAGVQTQDAHLFRYSEKDVVEMVIAWRMLTLFLPTTWYLVLYVADQASSVAVAADLCHAGERWWCGLTITFLVLPSLFLNAYAYGQLTQPDIATVAPLNKWVARALFLLQVAPHYLIGRKVSWCFRAWRAQSWTSKRRAPPLPPPAPIGRTPQELWDQAKEEIESSTTKWFHSLLESVPQLSVQSYILMVLLRPDQTVNYADVAVNMVMFSVAVSLTSASAGLASVVSERAWERIAASVAIFLTLGSRVMVCSGVGTIHPVLWFAPVTAATFLGFVTKVAESTEETYRAILVKAHKYIFNGFVMAAVCPPFDAVGLFSSAPYVLAGLCFLVLSPSNFANIAVFVMSIVGQIAWLAVGFFVTGER